MWIQISSGTGPDECEIAVGLFLKKYLNELKCAGMDTKVVDATPGSIPGSFKSILLSLDNEETYNLTKTIEGSVLWVSKSPIRPNHRRKNWFIDIKVFSETDKLSFSEKDVRIEAMRSSGPGGQNVNKVETAVRAVHLPTGLSVTASEERSQFMNKKLALARLSKLVEARNEKDRGVLKKSMWTRHSELVRGNPIRIYEGSAFKLKSKNA
ncbi:MAG: peptide chain release factor H [Clostridia bacterium]|nr:peptide chain release factor H [Clostridia bacterium]